MPNSEGKFLGITVPELPWQKEKRVDGLQAFKARGGGLHHSPHIGGSRSNLTTEDVADKVVEAAKLSQGKTSGLPLQGLRMAEMEPTVIELSDCPPDTVYVVDSGAVGTLAQHPQVAKALAKAETVVVAGPSVPGRTLEEICSALKRVGRIDL